MKKMLAFLLGFFLVCSTVVFFACQRPNESASESSFTDEDSSFGDSSGGGNSEDSSSVIEPPVHENAVFNGVTEYFLSNEDLVLGITLNDDEVLYAKLNGQTVSLTQTDGNLSIPNDLFGVFKYGANSVEISLSDESDYLFTVYKGVNKNEVLFYDFDVEKELPSGTDTISGTIEKNGIDGCSLKVTKNSDGGFLFGFGGDGADGFVPFTFESGTEYKLSFDIKILEGTSSEWWCPIRFGNISDVLYLWESGKMMTPAINNLYSQATIIKQNDGSYRVTAIFKADENCKKLGLCNWGGAVNVLLDNVCLIKLNPDVVKIACVGDSITEATLNNVSYPQHLQMLLGYDEYYVFNFGKSASNVLESGIYPYRTWAEWQYSYLKEWNADIIVSMLGTNDGRYGSGISTYGDKDFVDDYIDLLTELKTLAKKVYVALSPFAFGNEYGICADDVNGKIIKAESYVAYKMGLDVIDVNSATKICDREEYFPDYIHGSDKGYGVIASAICEGLLNSLNRGKYHLLYALDNCADKTSDKYFAALQIAEDKNATQAEIDSAFDLIENEMVIPAITESTLIANVSAIYAPEMKDVVIPVRIRKNTITSLTIENLILNSSDYTVTRNGIVVSDEKVTALKKGIFKITLKTGDNKTFVFALYNGYAETDISFIDSDISKYINKSDLFIPCEVVSDVPGMTGDCLHFYGSGGVLFGYNKDGAFGEVKFTIQTDATYTFSFDYKIGPDWNKTGGDAGMFMPMWFGYGNGDVIYWYNDLHTLNGNIAISSSITCIDEENEIYHFTVDFIAPVNCDTFELGGWLSFYDIYMDNITLAKKA